MLSFGTWSFIGTPETICQTEEVTTMEKVESSLRSAFSSISLSSISGEWSPALSAIAIEQVCPQKVSDSGLTRIV